MNRLPLLYLIAAAACLVAGVSLGIGMGLMHAFALAPVHAHVNLVGWTSLALMGLTARAWPELAEGRVAVAQFALSAGSGLLFPPGIYLAIFHGQPLLAIVAGFAWLAGAILYLARLVRLALAPAHRRAPIMVPAE